MMEYDHELGARFYLTKYVTKKIADIEFSGNLVEATANIMKA